MNPRIFGYLLFASALCARAENYACSEVKAAYRAAACCATEGGTTYLARGFTQAYVDAAVTAALGGQQKRTPINGGWSAWGALEPCSVTACGQTGTQTKRRTCTEPAPQYGGANCSNIDGGAATDSSTTCSTVACPPTAAPTAAPDDDPHEEMGDDDDDDDIGQFIDGLISDNDPLDGRPMPTQMKEMLRRMSTVVYSYWIELAGADPLHPPYWPELLTFIGTHYPSDGEDDDNASWCDYETSAFGGLSGSLCHSATSSAFNADCSYVAEQCNWPGDNEDPGGDCDICPKNPDLFDLDGDGVVAALDCDDTNPHSTTRATDVNCDGVINCLVDFGLGPTGVCGACLGDTGSVGLGHFHDQCSKVYTSDPGWLLDHDCDDDAMFNEACSHAITRYVTTMHGMFDGAERFNQNIGSWDTAAVTSMEGMFLEAERFNQNIGGWNTAAVTSMEGMFRNDNAFNQPLASWNTSSVTTMDFMFLRATAFNQDIGSWNTAAVTSMEGMFFSATAFNANCAVHGGWINAKLSLSTCAQMTTPQPTPQPTSQPTAAPTSYYTDLDGDGVLNCLVDFGMGPNGACEACLTGWGSVGLGHFNNTCHELVDSHPAPHDLLGSCSNNATFNEECSHALTGEVTTMESTFHGAVAFNQPLASWNTSSVTTMESMFKSASVFNQAIGAWNTAKVTNMEKMFNYANAFNQDIGSWNTSEVTSMSGMFRDNSVFNQNIGAWNTAAVTTMHGMFSFAYAFNQAIGSWNTAEVTTMSDMFHWASAFNQAIGAWNTSSVTDMSDMFKSASVFNQAIGAWNTAAVTDMRGMFEYASVFNYDLGSWNTANVTRMSGMFFDTSVFNANCANVGALCRWGKTKAQLGIAGSCPECPALDDTSVGDDDNDDGEGDDGEDGEDGEDGDDIDEIEDDADQTPALDDTSVGDDDNDDGDDNEDGEDSEDGDDNEDDDQTPQELLDDKNQMIVDWETMVNRPMPTKMKETFRGAISAAWWGYWIELGSSKGEDVEGAALITFISTHYPSDADQESPSASWCDYETSAFGGLSDSACSRGWQSSRRRAGNSAAFNANCSYVAARCNWSGDNEDPEGDCEICPKWSGEEDAGYNGL
jgi:surface protein